MAKLAWGRVMARRTILALAAAGGLALSLLPASSALAGSAFDEVLKDYQSDRQIDRCSHSAPPAGGPAGGRRAGVRRPGVGVRLEGRHAAPAGRAGDHRRDPALGRPLRLVRALHGLGLREARAGAAYMARGGLANRERDL